MKFVQQPVKNQKFEIGRVITLSKCGTLDECTNCDFMHCNNYCRKMERVIPTIDEFIKEEGNRLKQNNGIKEDEDLIYSFMDCFKFPKGIYWDCPNNSSIRLVKFSRSGKELECAYIDLGDGRLIDYDLTDTQYKFACKISEAVKKVNQWVKDNRNNMEKNYE